ncbi:MAG TPA: pilin [Candidatus Saccharimonadales bacterium]|nr:pilin [Candidatus Saccharimonadales bacterium]
MTKQIKKFLVATFSLVTIFSLSAAPALVHASSTVNTTVTSGLCNGVDNTTQGSSLNLGAASSTANDCTNDVGAGSTIGTLLTNIIDVMSILIGVVCVIMIIVGGFKYVTSGGESSNISGAKNTIVYALVGLVIVALAQVIVHFVLSRLTTP